MSQAQVEVSNFEELYMTELVKNVFSSARLAIESEESDESSQNLEPYTPVLGLRRHSVKLRNSKTIQEHF